MNTVILIVLAIAAVYAIAWTTRRFAQLISGDGYGHRPAPRSTFDQSVLRR
ncbi:hypothetical protein [Solicola gregarius]|uniref:Uncharacterized protein n=1 Tax=Solicola gregarius TaxID=2908642 RepID=A0AA46THL9_9ACTN|nr:hypothetical protein [Solicola gregarius]UYM05300.1 hypothetical protein L0C25_22770 [Solicola gregarius]